MKKIGLFFFIVACLGLFNCSSSKYYSASESSFQESGGNSVLAGNNNLIDEDEKVVRKVIFSAYLSLTVKNPDSVNVSIEKIAKKYNGYVNEIGTSRTVIRVENSKLKDAVNEISKLGKVNTQSMVGQDITDEYLDYEIRLENAEKSRKRYLELLDKAENVEAALKVEKELERVNQTIDLLKGKMNRINHLSEFSTITVNIKKKKKQG